MSIQITDAIMVQGLNKAFLGLGYQVSSNFSVGADAQYNFGKIETSSLEFILNLLVPRESNTANLSGVNFDVGAMYKAKLNSKLNVYSSLNYAFGNT
jgi:hypothetical protein